MGGVGYFLHVLVFLDFDLLNEVEAGVVEITYRVLLANGGGGVHGLLAYGRPV